MAFDPGSLETLLAAGLEDAENEPPGLVDVDMARTDRLSKLVLAIGAPIRKRDRGVLADLQVELQQARSLEEGLDALAAVVAVGRVPDAVVVDANANGPGFGLRFIRQIKRALRNELPRELAALCAAMTEVPFLIPPLGGDVEYAVFTTPSQWFLGRTDDVSFAKLLAHIRRMKR
jgi:hypothetical protein